MLSKVADFFDRYYDRLVAPLWLVRQWDSIDRDIKHQNRVLERPDFLIAILMGVLACLICLWGFSQTARVAAINTDYSIFLQADVPRIIDNMTDRFSDHDRTDVHPIASILLFPFGGLLMALGFEQHVATKILTILAMSCNAVLFSVLMRLIALPRRVGAIFAILFVSSASFVFWGALVELFPFACLSILLALFLMFRVQQSNWVCWVFVNIVTLGLTTPNWIFGLVATAARHKFRSFSLICFWAFMVVVALAIIQNALFYNASIFIKPAVYLEELGFVQPVAHARETSDHAWNLWDNLRSFFTTTLVATPSVVEIHNVREIVTSNQRTGLATGEISPIIATAAWVALFGLGVWGLIRNSQFRVPMVAIVLLLLSQIALYSVYGEVTFLYSLHFLPLLVIVGACAWYSAYPKLAVILSFVVIVSGTINNVQRFQETLLLADCVSSFDYVAANQRLRGIGDQSVEPESLEISEIERSQALKNSLAEVDLDKCSSDVER